MKPTVDIVIEDLIAATLGEDADLRKKHFLRESLRSLVRLGKTEQMLEIKNSVKKLAGAVTSHAGRRKAKVDLLMYGRGEAHRRGQQQQLEFDQSHPNPACSHHHRRE